MLIQESYFKKESKFVGQCLTFYWPGKFDSFRRDVIFSCRVFSFLVGGNPNRIVNLNNSQGERLVFLFGLGDIPALYDASSYYSDGSYELSDGLHGHGLVRGEI